MSRNSTAKGYSILFVDDEEKTLKYFSRFFSKDYNVLTAQNTSEAKEILDKSADEIGVLISDQRMPVEKGVELLKYAREKFPNIVRLLTTAYSDLGDAIEAVNRGEILRYIPKPWDINFLELEIRHAMRFFLINTEREQLRKEKLSVIQRVTSMNKAKDLIILCAGMTHIRYPLHAIRSLLLQVPYSSMSASTSYQYNDAWDLIKSEITEIITLANALLHDTAGANNFIFENLDIADRLKTIGDSVPAELSLHIKTESTKLEANPALIDKLLQLLLLEIPQQQNAGTGEIEIYISVENSILEIRINSCLDKNISPWNMLVQLLGIFLICHHHGGSVQIGENMIIHLPLTQDLASQPELEQHWQEQILDQYEVLPE